MIMKYNKDNEAILQNTCNDINKKYNIDISIEYKNNQHVIVFCNGHSSIIPYNYDCAHGILQGINLILQANKK